MPVTLEDLGYAQGVTHNDQNATFLSYRDFVQTIHVPAGKEALWSHFRHWFARHRQSYKGMDAHQVFEEIRGVITADAKGVLTRKQYGQLGVRQSIFTSEQRGILYTIFEKYQEWLQQDKLYDLNLQAHHCLPLVQTSYDFIIIDEVQDLTPVQLLLALKTLRKPGQFLLCGDSNQIVHPNFFSWSQVKSLFWQDAKLTERQQLHILNANVRNSQSVTAASDTLLKIKHARFGSIDRESNFLCIRY